LPLDVREELNRRLENGESGTDLVTWLNGHPKAKRVMAASFGGREITEQNLSEWRAGGFQDWLAQEEETDRGQDFVAAAEKLAKSVDSPLLADHLSRVLLMRYTEALANWEGPVTPEFRCKLEALRALRKDVVAMRRSEHEDLRMEMTQERFGWERERFDWETEKADQDSLDRECEREERYRQKLRHAESLRKLAEKFSQPPPKEEDEGKAESKKT